jgi:hypothetical protein
MIDPAFLSISTVVSVMALALGTYVLARNPHLSISRAFFIVMVLISIISYLDLLFLSSTSYGMAMIMLRLLEFCLVCTFGGFLYLSTFFARQSDHAVFSRQWQRYAGSVVLVASLSALFFAKVEMGPNGWFMPNSWEILGLGSVLLIFLGHSLRMLHRAYRSSRESGYGSLLAGLTLAMTVPFAYLALSSLLELFRIPFPSPSSPSYLITSLAFFYAIVRERLFDILPSADSSRVPIRSLSIKLEEGRSYAVEEKGTATAFRLFASELNAGRKGLIISRRHPEQIREEYGLRNTPMIWLADRPIKDAVSPSNLPLLERTVTRFMSDGGNKVVMVEGLDKMILETSSEKAMRFLFDLEDKALVNGSRLILSFDPDGLSERDLALLMRDMVVLDHEGSVLAGPSVSVPGQDRPGAVGFSLSSHRSA